MRSAYSEGADHTRAESFGDFSFEQCLATLATILDVIHCFALVSFYGDDLEPALQQSSLGKFAKKQVLYCSMPIL